MSGVDFDLRWKKLEKSLLNTTNDDGQLLSIDLENSFLFVVKSNSNFLGNNEIREKLFQEIEAFSRYRKILIE